MTRNQPLLQFVCVWKGGGCVTKAGLAVDPVHQMPLIVWALDANWDLGYTHPAEKASG
jgi:hypothetical protein